MCMYVVTIGLIMSIRSILQIEHSLVLAQLLHQLALFPGYLVNYLDPLCCEVAWERGYASVSRGWFTLQTDHIKTM